MELTMLIGFHSAFFNDISFVSPKVPSIFTTLTTGSAANDAAIYGTDSHAYVLEKDQVYEVVLNNDDTGTHPIHFHGRAFQVVYRSAEDAGHYDPSANVTFHSVPARRDTIYVPASGHFVLRFKADNPGIWIFHCHIEWHMDVGLAAIFVEAPMYIQEHFTVPENHYEICNASGVATAGNAAGNTEDVYDLTGENKSVAPLPAGFTARGIVALVFSCVAAFAGMASIVW
jgi:iron transport multicopper oxidase